MPIIDNITGNIQISIVYFLERFDFDRFISIAAKNLKWCKDFPPIPGTEQKLREPYHFQRITATAFVFL
jgi:hypothetical protein